MVTALFALLAAAAGAACSSSPEGCDSSRCAQGSACIDDGSGTGAICRRVCTQQAECPSGSYCNDGRPVSWCAESSLLLPPGPGHWGTPCAPSGGFDDNPACDTYNFFFCHGASPADANATCTYYACQVDTDCPGGWWCATVDDQPNVTTANRSFGPTHPVCLPRQYCAPCRLDHDCSPAADGSPEHCVAQGPDGTGFCSPQCATNDQCPLDATCAQTWGVCAARRCAADGDCQASGSTEVCLAGACAHSCTVDSDCPPSNGRPQHCAASLSGGVCAAQACLSDDDCPPTLGTFQHCSAGACTPECVSDADCNAGLGDQSCVGLSVCMPRAGTCKGDGTFCSPCRSDADCTQGFCLESTYSKERFCSQTVQGAMCVPMATLPAGACPGVVSGVNYKAVVCSTADSDFSPKNQCIGEVTFGTNAGQVQYDTGCWTLNR